MGYYSSSGVIRGVHVSKADHEVADQLQEAGLYTYLYTDTNIWFMVVGKVIASMEEDGPVREVKIEAPDPHEDHLLLEKIRATGLVSEDDIEKNFGTWFIQGGS